MPQSGRNESLTMVVVDESSKSFLYDEEEEHDEQVRDHLITNEETIKISVDNDGRVERLGKD